MLFPKVLRRDFVDDFVSDLKTATIDSVDDLVDDFDLETAIWSSIILV